MSRSLTQKKFSKRLWILVIIFAAAGTYFVFQSFAINKYNPYNPPSETGIATYYDNTVVGGPGHCAAIHYSRGKKLKVTNKAVGSELFDTSIGCLVSDAGPFGDGRVIDLNTDDFIKLAGSTSLGVLPVRLELITGPEPEPPFGISCDPAVSQNNETISTIDHCDIDQSAISVEPTREPQKNAFDVIFIFTRDVFKLILDIF